MHYLVFVLLVVISCRSPSSSLETGDIIFHTSKSSQSKAIQLATGSKYSHMGMIIIKDEREFVLEAGKSVRFTPLKDWIARGVGKHYVVKRLKKRLEEAEREKLVKAADSFLGKSYDLYFEWSNKRIYCSELVWKIYHQALGKMIGQLQQLKSFNLTDPHVKQKLIERFGDNVPLEEKVVSPDAMFQSSQLTTVLSN